MGVGRLGLRINGKDKNLQEAGNKMMWHRNSEEMSSSLSSDFASDELCTGTDIEAAGHLLLTSFYYMLSNENPVLTTLC